MDEADLDLMRKVARYLDRVNALAAREATDALTPLGITISEHLGVDPTGLPVVQESVPDHRWVDTDIVLEQLQGDCGGELIGIRGGGDFRGHAETAELIGSPHARFSPGPVDYTLRPTGPDTTRRVVALGVRLVHYQGQPVAVLQRAANPRYGRDAASVDVLGSDAEVVSSLLAHVREQMVAVSVLRRQVIALAGPGYEGTPGVAFLRRPEVSEADVVLPAGVLDAIVAHVVGIGAHRELLHGLGQHLKRGVLLYGPPGTGKTLTLRHLVARAPESTVILLRGAGLGMVQEAAAIARIFQPSIVVLEDLDLVAMERSFSPQPLLFEVLDALDGLDGDADVAFLMTTNRVDVLEPALAQRPGRVDLAMEIPLPEVGERQRLIKLYARDLGFSEQAILGAAERTEGTTGAFAKELVRAGVLLAAGRGEKPDDTHLEQALDSLLSSGRQLTRRMLGGEAPPQEAVGWTDD